MEVVTTGGGCKEQELCRQGIIAHNKREKRWAVPVPLLKIESIIVFPGALADRHEDSLQPSTRKETALLRREEKQPWHCSEAGAPRQSGVMHWAWFSRGGEGPTLISFGPSARKTL